MVLRNGRAPYAGSYPSSTSFALASSVTSIVIFCSAKRLCKSFIIRSTICTICSFSNPWNTMVSSTRFKNSGRKDAFSASITRDFILSYSALFSSSLLAVPKPTVLFLIWLAPILEVMIITVFLKSTVLPWLSVNRPSSSTCNKILNTSGWAFSISSNNTIEYGFRRTASVNWPPSS